MPCILSVECLIVYGQFCKKWPKLYNVPIPSTFWDIVNDGMELLNGDYEALILNIKDVMDTKAI